MEDVHRLILGITFAIRTWPGGVRRFSGFRQARVNWITAVFGGINVRALGRPFGSFIIIRRRRRRMAENKRKPKRRPPVDGHFLFERTTFRARYNNDNNGVTKLRETSYVRATTVTSLHDERQTRSTKWSRKILLARTPPPVGGYTSAAGEKGGTCLFEY